MNTLFIDKKEGRKNKRRKNKRKNKQYKRRKIERKNKQFRDKNKTFSNLYMATLGSL